MKTRGFTLIELLVVIVILGVLVTLGSRSLRAARISAKKAQAQVEMKSIETAVKSYYSKYGKLPHDRFNADLDIDFLSEEKGDDASADVIAVLTMGDDNLTGLNPAEVVFLDAQSSSLTNQFLDPWGYQYRIALDTDYDGEIVLADGTILRRKVGVASVGLYYTKGLSDTNDLVFSWQ